MAISMIVRVCMVIGMIVTATAIRAVFVVAVVRRVVVMVGVMAMDMSDFSGAGSTFRIKRRIEA